MKRLMRVFVFGAIVASVLIAAPSAAKSPAEQPEEAEICREGRFISYARGGFLSHTYYVFLDAEQGRISFWEAEVGHFMKGEQIYGLAPGEHSPAKGVSGFVAELDAARWQREAVYFRQLTSGWQQHYLNTDILDGIRWNFFVCSDNDFREYSGSNAYPANFEELRQHLQELYREFGGRERVPF